MMTRAEKLFNIRAQVAKAMNLREHGDNWGTDGALGDALIAIAMWLEEEVPEKPAAVTTETLVQDLPPPAQPTRLKVKK